MWGPAVGFPHTILGKEGRNETYTIHPIGTTRDTGLVG